MINPDQKISMMEAIKFYTLDSAYASYEEKIKGSIEVGKLADMVILSQNPLTTSPGEIMELAKAGTFMVLSVRSDERHPDFPGVSAETPVAAGTGAAEPDAGPFGEFFRMLRCAVRAQHRRACTYHSPHVAQGNGHHG